MKYIRIKLAPLSIGDEISSYYWILGLFYKLIKVNYNNDVLINAWNEALTDQRFRYYGDYAFAVINGDKNGNSDYILIIINMFDVSRQSNDSLKNIENVIRKSLEAYHNEF